MMNPSEIQNIIQEQERRNKLLTQLKNQLFDKQVAVIEDSNMFRAVLGSRRIGKSWLIGTDLISTCIEEPGCTALYLALTKGTATATMNRHIVSPILTKFNIDVEWKDVKGAWEFPNGSVLYMRGAQAGTQALDRIVGQKFAGTVWVDECGAQPRTEELVYDKIVPAAAEGGGRVALCGTPGKFADGLFYRATRPASHEKKEPGWTAHHWIWSDNPHVANGKMKQTHDQLIHNNPNIINTPGYRREWLGEWVEDDATLVYRASQSLNALASLPTKTKEGRELNPQLWHYLLSVDIGYVDATAFLIAAWHDHDPRLFFVQCLAKKKMLPDEIEKLVKGMWFAPDLGYFGQYRFERFIIDTGGLGLSIAEQMRQRGRIPWIAAKKQGKIGNIDLFNAALLTGQIQVLPAASYLFHEWAKLPWQYKEVRGLKTRMEHPAFDNHGADAALYAFMHARNFHASNPPPTPSGRDETDKWADEYWAKEIEKQRQARDNPLQVDQFPEWDHFMKGL